MLSRFFTTPALLWSLATLPALGLLLLIARRRKRTLLARLGPPGVIAGQIERPPGRWRAAVGWTLGLGLLAAAIAGPHWGLGPPPPTAPGRDIVVVLDLSRSMLAQDALPSRLGRSKDGLVEFAGARLNAFLNKAATAALVGGVLDEPATGQGLLGFFLRGVQAGAVTEAEALSLTGLSAAEFHQRSIVSILRSRAAALESNSGR